jgi:hypothetical protein
VVSNAVASVDERAEARCVTERQSSQVETQVPRPGADELIRARTKFGRRGHVQFSDQAHFSVVACRPFDRK